MTPWVKQLLEWFEEHQRSMPWRDNPLPYNVWVSEIMLQQTQVDTVIPYFNRFLDQFPTVYELANSELEPVLKAWEGLGYYTRARNLHKAAQTIVNDYNGQLPQTFEGLQKISGIGPYCAAAIGSIAFELPVPVVDGNVLRVFSRFWGIYDDIANMKTRNMMFDKLTPYVKQAQPSQFNQAIMELGALICSPTSPKCKICPLQQECFAFNSNKQMSLPVKKKKEKVPHYNIGVGVLVKDNKVLIAKRKTDGMLGGLWEFPGGKQKDKENIETTVSREFKEETDVSIKIQTKICEIKHAYSHFKITLHAFNCVYEKGLPKANSSQEIKWCALDELEKHPFPTANKKIIKLLQDLSS